MNPFKEQFNSSASPRVDVEEITNAMVVEMLRSVSRIWTDGGGAMREKASTDGKLPICDKMLDSPISNVTLVQKRETRIVKRLDGGVEYHTNGVPDREDGPAVISGKWDLLWYKNGELHNLDGPAIRRPNGITEYWVDGWITSQCGHRDAVRRFREAN